MIYDYGVMRIRCATSADAAALAPRLRQADLNEIEAGSGKPPLEVLEAGLRLSTEAYAVELSSTGEVVALFGVAPTEEPKLGAVWLLGSDKISSIRFTFLRQSKQWLTKLFSRYQLLGNSVDARNTLHVEWLRWLGFRFLRKSPVGRNGELFIEFVRLPDSP